MTHSSDQPKRGEFDRFEQLVQAVTDYALYMLDPRGNIISWNTGAERLKGFEPVEIIGQHFSRFFTEDDRKADLPARLLAEAARTGRAESEGWRVRKDGSQFWSLAVLDIVRDTSGKLIGFAKITRDMTERKRAQEQLLESERRFRLLVEGVVDYAIYMIDPSGIITNWNVGAERMKGYSVLEVVGQHFSKFYTAEERAQGLPGRALHIASTEGRYEAEGWRVRKDGTTFWATVVLDAIRDEEAKLLGFAKITRDITERREAALRVSQSEREFRLLVDGVIDYALYMLDLNGIVTNWNQGAERIKGYKAHEIVGQHFSRFYTESERANGAPFRSLHTAATTGRYDAEGWRVRKDGSLFWASVVIDAIRDESGKLIGFAKITRDITERRNNQRALEESQQHLAHAQKMEALGHLTGGVAHDFNNLLTIFGGGVRALRKMLEDNPKGLQTLDALEGATRRGASLTSQLLTFSRRQSVNPEVIAVGAALDAIRRMIASSVGRSVKIVVTCLPGTWPIDVDLSEFELAILNLSLNARDAMPEGGYITITAENTNLGGSETPARLKGNFVSITVADTGAGIPPDILGKVFDPFFSTKGVGKGTGLGLSQVHGFAHQAGGTISLVSEMGKGTRFTLYLPRSLGAPDREKATSVQQQTSGVALLVEDNPEVAEVARALLADTGLSVSIASDAEAALGLLEKHRFDLVVSDIVMTGSKNGLELAREIRLRFPGIPVILATGYSDVGDDAAREFYVLRKPFQFADVEKAVGRALLRPRTNGNLLGFDDARRAKRMTSTE